MVSKIQLIEAGHCTHPERMVNTHGSLKSIRFPSTVAVIHHEKHGPVLFDTGYSMNFYEATKYLPEKLYALATPVTISPETTAKAQLKKMGISASDVRTVICSHFHADHIGGLSDFPEATYISDNNAYEHLSKKSKLGAVKAGFLEALIPKDFLNRSKFIPQLQLTNTGITEFPQGYDLFGDKSILLIALPGHACGHYGALVTKRNGEKLFFIADAGWQKESVAKLQYPSILTSLIIEDFGGYKKTLQRLHQTHLAHKDVQIIPCHCDSTLKSWPCS